MKIENSTKKIPPGKREPQGLAHRPVAGDHRVRPGPGERQLQVRPHLYFLQYEDGVGDNWKEYKFFGIESIDSNEMMPILRGTLFKDKHYSASL